ncbi:MAG: 30S ribosomal protein S20 [Candidatus Omnitrophica bacterium]|nr:30S ribosomal protein S20 [Candidatus Omnitrophota bacterium]
MPNTKSAERRMRNSARKRLENRSAKTRLKSLEGKFLALVQAGNKEEGPKALKLVSSALDKAAKSGAVHWAKADRKKSRLALKLNGVK